MICAAAPGKDACINDGGGPLITNEGKFYSAIGNKLLFFCLTCLNIHFIGIAIQPAYTPCGTREPGLYSRVTKALTWIQENISGETCPKPT